MKLSTKIALGLVTVISLCNQWGVVGMVAKAVVVDNNPILLATGIVPETGASYFLKNGKVRYEVEAVTAEAKVSENPQTLENQAILDEIVVLTKRIDLIEHSLKTHRFLRDKAATLAAQGSENNQEELDNLNQVIGDLTAESRALYNRLHKLQASGCPTNGDPCDSN
jgi:hypothetical protein